jgi:hypothetical protein
MSLVSHLARIFIPPNFGKGRSTGLSLMQLAATIIRTLSSMLLHMYQNCVIIKTVREVCLLTPYLRGRHA